MEKFKNLLTKIMSYTTISFELKFKHGRIQKDILADFMFVAMAFIPVILQNSVEVLIIHASCWC